MDGGLGMILLDAMPHDTAPRMECKICWYVYDPQAGDEVWQVAPGTAFAKLPEHWSCPECAATKADFLVLRDD